MRSRILPSLSYLLSLVVAALFALPLYWAGVASLRRPDLPPAPALEWWLASPHWENLLQIFRLLPMGLYLRNSLLVVALAVPLTWLTAALAGFGLARLPERVRRPLLTASVAVMMIPGMALWVFRYRLLLWLGLADSLWALIVPAVAAGSPLFVLLFYWTYRRIPSDLYDAARVDGAGPWRLWWKVALPLARPTSFGVLILAFLMYWNDFSGPVVYVRRPEWYTLPVGLQLLKQAEATNWPLLMAAAMVMIVPIVPLFLLLQRVFLHNLLHES